MKQQNDSGGSAPKTQTKPPAYIQKPLVPKGWRELSGQEIPKPGDLNSNFGSEWKPTRFLPERTVGCLRCHCATRYCTQRAEIKEEECPCWNCACFRGSYEKWKARIGYDRVQKIALHQIKMLEEDVKTLSDQPRDIGVFLRYWCDVMHAGPLRNMDLLNDPRFRAQDEIILDLKHFLHDRARWLIDHEKESETPEKKSRKKK